MNEVKTIGEQLEELGEYLLQKNMDFIEQARRGEPVLEKDQMEYDALEVQFTNMEKVYTKLLKLGKASGKNIDRVDKDLVKRISERKSTIGDIQRGEHNT